MPGARVSISTVSMELLSPRHCQCLLLDFYEFIFPTCIIQGICCEPQAV